MVKDGLGTGESDDAALGRVGSVCGDGDGTGPWLRPGES